MNKIDIIQNILHGFLINDTVDLLFAVPLTKEEAERAYHQIKEKEFCTIRRVKLKKEHLVLMTDRYTAEFSRVVMPDRNSVKEEGVTIVRKFLYTKAPLTKNHLAALKSNVEGHYGNAYIPTTMVGNTEEQYIAIKAILRNPDYILIIKL